MILCGIALAYTGAGCALPPLAEEAAMNVGPISVSRGEQRVVDNVVIVTDGSGTTYVDQTFPKAKSLSQAVAAALPEPDAPASSKVYNAGNIGFGGSERAGTDLAAFDRGALRAGVDSTRVMGQPGGGGGTTPIHRVLGEIGEQLQGKTGKAAVVLVSDGDVSCQRLSFDAARTVAESHSSEVCIHTVQVGTRPGGDEFLAKLAASGSPCGSHRRASDVATPAALSDFVHDVMIGGQAAAAPRPTRAPAGPSACEGMVLEGVSFATNSADLVGRSAAVLDAVVGQLATCPNARLTVEGHTDARGSAEYNQALSERRANSVRDYLIGAGIDGSRLKAVGIGEARPIASGETAEAYRRNRRVELRAQ
jgi:outer membrane protein OmpA-like peptidoglycan-associated protein